MNLSHRFRALISWVAGIRFESFKVIRTIALAVVKIGHELEINLLGISSLTLPSVYVELAFSVQFAPARGIFMARGLLTASSYILFPGLRLSGGFAVDSGFPASMPTTLLSAWVDTIPGSRRLLIFPPISPVSGSTESWTTM